MLKEDNGEENDGEEYNLGFNRVMKELMPYL